jgi:hypothetical protein
MAIGTLHSLTPGVLPVVALVASAGGLQALSVVLGEPCRAR